MTNVVADHVVVRALLVLILVGVVALAVVRPAPPLVAKSVGYGLGGIAALYLVVRAIAEFFVVDYSDPSSYRTAWGGPSLVGVFVVHTGPGVVVVVAVVGYLLHWWPRSRRTSRAGKPASKESGQGP